MPHTPRRETRRNEEATARQARNHARRIALHRWTAHTLTLTTAHTLTLWITTHLPHLLTTQWHHWTPWEHWTHWPW